MYQLRQQLGVNAYINKECGDVMSHTFTKDFVDVPIFEEVFCNPQVSNFLLLKFRSMMRQKQPICHHFRLFHLYLIMEALLSF